jgi:hypothetical protein
MNFPIGKRSAENHRIEVEVGSLTHLDDFVGVIRVHKSAINAAVEHLEIPPILVN